MGAPKTAYGAYNIWLTGTKADTTPINIESGVAKFIRITSGNNGYFLDSDIVGNDQSLAVAKVKDLFKLDRLVTIQADGVTGFIGQVECDSNGVPIGVNATFHRDYTETQKNRYFGIIDTVKDAFGNVKYYRYFNDAGLNVKGTVPSYSAKSDLGHNGIKITAVYKSAFYARTTDFGFYFKANENPEEFQRSFLSTIGINTSRQITDREEPTVPSGGNLVAGDTLYIAPYIQNEEGIKKYDFIAIDIIPYIEYFRYFPDPDIADSSIGLGTGSNTPLGFVKYEKAIGDLAYQPINPEIEPDALSDFEGAEIGTYATDTITLPNGVRYYLFYRVKLNGSNFPCISGIGGHTPQIIYQTDYSLSDASYAAGEYVPGPIPTSQTDALGNAKEIAKNISNDLPISVYRNDNIPIEEDRTIWYAFNYTFTTPVQGTYVTYVGQEGYIKTYTYDTYIGGKITYTGSFTIEQN